MEELEEERKREREERERREKEEREKRERREIFASSIFHHILHPASAPNRVGQLGPDGPDPGVGPDPGGQRPF